MAIYIYIHGMTCHACAIVLDGVKKQIVSFSIESESGDVLL